MSVTLAAYQDILYCSRPVSRHPKMSIENRAKLFTPFSALRGFDIEILTQEQDRLLMPQISLASDREEDLPDLALALALRSYADKLACQRLLELIRERRPQPEKGKKSRSGREHPAD